MKWKNLHAASSQLIQQKTVFEFQSSKRGLLYVNISLFIQGRKYTLANCLVYEAYFARLKNRALRKFLRSEKEKFCN